VNATTVTVAIAIAGLIVAFLAWKFPQGKESKELKSITDDVKSITDEMLKRMKDDEAAKNRPSPSASSPSAGSPSVGLPSPSESADHGDGGRFSAGESRLLADLGPKWRDCEPATSRVTQAVTAAITCNVTDRRMVSKTVTTFAYPDTEARDAAFDKYNAAKGVAGDCAKGTADDFKGSSWRGSCYPVKTNSGNVWALLWTEGDTYMFYAIDEDAEDLWKWFQVKPAPLN
jgi:hypothetical protein